MKKKYLILFSFILILLLKDHQLRGQGQLWGMTQNGGSSGIGVIYKTNADATGYTVQYNFPTAYPGAGPKYTRMVKLPNGKMFGMTEYGGVYDYGVIFEYDPATNIYTKRFDFTTTSGYGPEGSLVYASNGKLYGLTRLDGGGDRVGTLFEFDPVTYTFTKKIAFGGTLGWYPRGSLIQASNGKLYGMSLGGTTGNSAGVLFEYNPATNVCTNKFELKNTTGTGISPYGDLTETTPGKLYGMTNEGGANGLGTIFEYDLNAFTTDPFTGQVTYGIFTKKFDFSAASGNKPYGSLTYVNQKLYGMTYSGGANSGGVLFEFDPATTTYTKKVDFNGSLNGANPYGNLSLASNGKLYGLTNSGGANSTGTIIEYDPGTGIFTKKGDFPAYTAELGWAQGGYPMGSLAEGSNGKFYGLTGTQTGLAGAGTIFEFTLATSTYTKKIDLNYGAGGTSHGSSFIETTTLTQSSANGRFYGTTTYGGANNKGVIFEFNPANLTYTKRFDFNQASNGTNPGSKLIEAFNGKLYGVTKSGGTANYGTLYEYNPATNAFTKKVDFNSNGPLGGSFQRDNLVLTSSGKIYGATTYGGANGMGVFFEFDPSSGTCIKKIDIPPSVTWAAWITYLMQAANGKLYGLITGNQGALIEIDPVANTLSRKVEFTGANGVGGPGSMFEYVPGKLLGVTTYGGSINQEGVLFEYDYINNAYVKKVTFPSYPEPSMPYCLVQSSNGNIYGTARAAIFQYDTTTQSVIKKYGFDYSTGDLSPGLLQVEKPNVCVTAPANGALNQNVTVTVSAKALTGATTYTIEVNDSPIFAGTSIVKSGARSQSFTGLSYNKQYFTRVKTNLSPVWSFVTTFTTASPEYFTYVAAPANAATGQNVNLTVTANSVIGAATYTIELNTASDFTGTSIVKSGARSQVFNDLALSTTYYTRVKTDLSPNWGQTRSFTTGDAATLSYVTTPANNAINQLWALNITANKITGASTYIIELSPISDFSSGVIQRTGATPVLSFAGLSYSTQYYSRVSTDLSPGVWGPLRSFTTGNPANFSYITSPANGAVNVNWVITLTSNLVLDATQYTIEANTAADFTGTSIIQTSNSRSIVFTLAYDQLYYVRVKTNLTSSWGPTRSFTTGSPVSFAYVTSPANNAANVATTVNVSSNIVTGATSYTIELNTASDFTGTSIVKTGASRTINFAGLAAATTYYSRVNTNLSSGIWGATRSFTTIGSGRIDQHATDEIAKETTGSFSIDVLNNPFRQSLRFVINTPVQEEAVIKLIDLTGRVFHESCQKTKTVIEITAPIAQGIYLLQARTSSRIDYTRVMKID